MGKHLFPRMLLLWADLQLFVGTVNSGGALRKSVKKTGF